MPRKAGLVMELVIYTGTFGSGKTEISLNHAISEVRRGRKVTLIDLDIIKPYFRSREAAAVLENEGIRLVSPHGSLAGADLPVVTPEITGALISGEGLAIIDVGGDTLGAVALGRFKPYIDALGGYLQLVVNPYRPFTGTHEGVARLMESIQKAARLETRWIISNPNLGRETTLDTVLEGHAAVEKMSRSLGIPVKFLAVYKPLLSDVSSLLPGVEVFPVENYMLPPWYQEVNRLELEG